MRGLSVLVSGAGIAGPAVAYWLLRHGSHPVLVERAPAPRTGGYIVDFWGVGYDVAERMGIIAEIRRNGYQIKEFRVVNARGRRVGGFNVDVFRAATHGRYVTIARSDLVKSIFRQVEGRCETIFGDSIASVKQSGNAVDWT